MQQQLQKTLNPNISVFIDVKALQDEAATAILPFFILAKLVLAQIAQHCCCIDVLTASVKNWQPLVLLKTIWLPMCFHLFLIMSLKWRKNASAKPIQKFLTDLNCKRTIDIKALLADK